MGLVIDKMKILNKVGGERWDKAADRHEVKKGNKG